MSELKELLKLAADSLKNETLSKLLENDLEFQKKSKEEINEKSNVHMSHKNENQSFNNFDFIYV